MKIHKCLNGKEGCYIVELHRHEVGGAVTWTSSGEPLRTFSGEPGPTLTIPAPSSGRMGEEWPANSSPTDPTDSERLDQWKVERQREYERVSEEGGQLNIGEDFSDLLDIALKQQAEIAALRERAERAEEKHAKGVLVRIEETGKLIEERDSAEAERDRLAKIIEDAPHEFGCASRPARLNTQPCNCWKARAALGKGNE